MPKETFFNLNPEKRRKIEEAILEEFSKTPIEKASISNIITNANIPRGSFYQYFESKEELIDFIIEQHLNKTEEEFANKIDNILIENSNVDFIIGGSYGLSADIKNMSRLHLSFSKMTFPHQLFRVLLLEQIYRAYKINNNESYHK